MDSIGIAARDRVLAELAALGPVPGDGLGLLVQVRQVAVFADQVLGQLARLAGLVDSTGAFAAAGYASAAAFLRHGCGRSAGRAGELVATGRALPRLQATNQALDQGLVSFDATHVISRATAQIEDDTLAAAAEQQLLTAATTGRPGSRSAAEAARTRTGDADGEQPAAGAPWPEWVAPGLDPRELRRLGEDLTYRADPDGVEERQRQRFERRYLSFGVTLDNAGTISGACGDALSMEIIRTAAEAFSPPGGSHDRRTAAQRRMDGLTAACQAALDSGTAKSRPRRPAPPDHPARRRKRQPVTARRRPAILPATSSPPQLAAHPGSARGQHGPPTAPCSPPARSSPWPATPRSPSSAGATGSPSTPDAATAPTPPPCAAP